MNKLSFLLCLFAVYAGGSASDYIFKYNDYTPSLYGSTGLISMPTARLQSEGTVTLHYSSFSPYSRLAIVASPYNWLEVLYHYTDIDNLLYSQNTLFSGNQTYKDKGFDIKLKLFDEGNYIPDIALGFRDAAGTGIFASEYLVATKNFKYLDATLGFGWGTISNNGIENPLGSISSDYFDRGATKVGQGGNFSFKQFFKGQNTGIFGGFEFFFPQLKKLKFKVELDSTNYFDEGFSPPDQDSKVNFGLVYSVNNSLKFQGGYIRGNTISFGFNLTGNFAGKNPVLPKFDDHKPIENAEIKKSLNATEERYLHLTILKELTDRKLNIRSVNRDKNKLSISMAQNTHMSYPRAYGRAARALDEIAPDEIDEFEIISMNSIFEMAAINIPRKEFIINQKQNNSEITFSQSEIYQTYKEANTHDFQPSTKLPAAFYSFGPAISSQLGGPDRFFVGGLSLRGDAEVLFRRNISLQSIIRVGLFDSFGVIKNSSESLLPRVRTDINEYLKQPNLFSITRLQLNWFDNPFKSIYTKFSTGYFEEMFGGYGSEILYRPFRKNWAISAQAYRVKQREFKQLLKFNKTRDYETSTGHITLYLKEPRSNTLLTLSGGRYLAKDSGITVDFSRRFKSGMLLGAYFTKTDVSATEFGEGSFDKGFYLNFPIEAFFTNYRKGLTSYGLRPMTRDGGAKLIVGHDLWGVTDEGSYMHIYRDREDLYD